MRDIRNDLRERLAAIDGRQCDEMIQYQDERERLDAAHQNSIALLERERAAVKQLLEIEERRELSLSSRQNNERSPPAIPLMDFLVAKVQSFGPFGKDELRAAATEAGYLDEATGRTFHVTLMNITKGGRLRQLPDGRYAMPDTALSLFGLGESTMEDEMQEGLIPAV